MRRAGQLRMKFQPIALEVLHHVGLTVGLARFHERLRNWIAINRQSACLLPVGEKSSRDIVSGGIKIGSVRNWPRLYKRSFPLPGCRNLRAKQVQLDFVRVGLGRVVRKYGPLEPLGIVVLARAVHRCSRDPKLSQPAVSIPIALKGSPDRIAGLWKRGVSVNEHVPSQEPARYQQGQTSGSRQ